MLAEPAALDRQLAMTLPELIFDMGDAAAAALFGVKLRTVQSWRRRERYPRPEMAWTIVEKAGGRIDYAGIFGPPPPAVAMTLSELISNMGDAGAAALFGVKLRTVQSWRRRERYPRPEMAWTIVEKADGRIDYAGIFGPPPPAAAANHNQLQAQ